MSNEPNIQSTRTHVPPLDGLRGIAVLLVIWSHVPADLGGAVVNLLNKVVQPGYLGVDIFFVLSGFLITRILLYGRFNGKSLRYFLVRRAFRIFPIYYLLILVLVYLAPGEYLVWCATYLSNFVFSFDYLWNADLQRWIPPSNPMRHTWSLSVEEHFYMIWPLFIYFAPRDWLRPTTVAVVLTGMVLAVMAVMFAEELPLYKLLYRGTPFRMSSLALGGLFALYEPSLRIGTARPWRYAGVFFVPAVVFLTVAAMLENPWTQAMKMIGFSLMSSTIFLATLGTLCLGPRIGVVLSRGPLAYAGRISYGIYLYHYPIFYSLGLLGHESSHTIWLTVQGVALTFAVATGSYYLLERPILRYASRYR
jgi:peptidoglycan/LPS O-acetylase OafA/YrhL